MSDDLIEQLRLEKRTLTWRAADAIERKDAALRAALEALEPITSGIYWDSVEIVKARDSLTKIKEALND